MPRPRCYLDVDVNYDRAAYQLAEEFVSKCSIKYGLSSDKVQIITKKPLHVLVQNTIHLQSL